MLWEDKGEPLPGTKDASSRAGAFRKTKASGTGRVTTSSTPVTTWRFPVKGNDLPEERRDAKWISRDTEQD
jgi:hypothetical protein